MEIRQLEYFREVCRHENITRACEVLHISQPSVTVSIKRLESELGVELFHRINKRLSLTEEGRQMLNQAERILSLIDDTKNMMLDFHDEPQGLLRIGITPMMSVLFTSNLAKFQRNYPRVEIEVIEEGSLSISALIEKGELDLGVIISKNLPSCLAHQPICRGNIVACLPKTHRFADKKEVSLIELKKDPFILFHEDTYTRQLIMNECTKLNFTPKVVFSSSQIDTVEGLVKESMGVSFFFSDLAKRLDSVAIIPLAERLELEAGAVWNSEKYLSSAAKKLIDLLSPGYSNNNLP